MGRWWSGLGGAVLLGQGVPALAEAAPSVELVAQGGVAGPGPWSDGADRQRLGPSAHLGGFVGLSPALALGLGAEWAHLGWRTQLETDESVDTLLAAPELRWRSDPSGSASFTAALGLGWAFVWPSVPSDGHIEHGGPAARAALGWEFAVLPSLRLGAELGASTVVNFSADGCACRGADPGAPVGAGNLWALRAGARWGVF